MTVAGVLSALREKAAAAQRSAGFNTIAATSGNTTESLRQVLTQLASDPLPRPPRAKIAAVRDFLALIYPHLDSFVRRGNWHTTPGQRRRLDQKARAMVKAVILRWNGEVRAADPDAPVVDVCDSERFRTKAKEEELLERAAQSLKAQRMGKQRKDGLRPRLRAPDYIASVSWFGEIFQEIELRDANYVGIVSADEADRTILSILRESKAAREGKATSQSQHTSSMYDTMPPSERRAVDTLADFPSRRIVTITNDGDDIAILPADLRGWAVYPYFKGRCDRLDFPPPPSASPSSAPSPSPPPEPPPGPSATARAVPSALPNPAFSRRSAREGGELGACCIVYQAESVDALPGFGVDLGLRALRALVRGHDYCRGGLRGVGTKALEVLPLHALQRLDLSRASPSEFAEACASDFKILSLRTAAAAAQRRILNVKAIKGSARPDDETSKRMLRGYRTMLCIGTAELIEFRSLRSYEAGRLVFDHPRNQARALNEARRPSPPRPHRPNPPREWDHPLRPGRTGTPLIIQTTPLQPNPWHDYLVALEPERPPSPATTTPPDSTSSSPAASESPKPPSSSSASSATRRELSLHALARELAEQEEEEGAELDDADETASVSSSKRAGTADGGKWEPKRIVGLYRPASTAQLPLDAVERCIDRSLIRPNAHPPKTSTTVRERKRRPGSWKKWRDRRRFAPYSTPRRPRTPTRQPSSAGPPNEASSAGQLKRLRPVAYVLRLLFFCLTAANIFAMPVLQDYLMRAVATEKGVSEVGRLTKERNGIRRLMSTICSRTANRTGCEAVGRPDRVPKLAKIEDLEDAINSALRTDSFPRPARLTQGTYAAAYAPYETSFRVFAARVGGDIVDLFGHVASAGMLNASTVGAQTFAAPTDLLSPRSAQLLESLRSHAEWFGFASALSVLFRTVAEEFPFTQERALTGADPTSDSPPAPASQRPVLSADQSSSLREALALVTSDAKEQAALEADTLKVLSMLVGFRDRGIHLALLEVGAAKVKAYDGKTVTQIVRDKEVRRALAGFGVKIRFIIGTQGIPTFAPSFFSTHIEHVVRCLEEVGRTRLAAGAVRIGNCLLETLAPRLVVPHSSDSTAAAPEALRTILELFDVVPLGGTSSTVGRTRQLMSAIRLSRMNGRPVRLKAREDLLEGAKRTCKALATVFGTAGSLAKFVVDQRAHMEMCQAIFRTDVGPAHFGMTGAMTFSSNSISFFGIRTNQFLDTPNVRAYVKRQLERRDLEFGELDEGTAWSWFGAKGWTNLDAKRYKERDNRQLCEYAIDSRQHVRETVVPQVVRYSLARKSIEERFAESIEDRSPRSSKQTRIEPGNTLHSYSPITFVPSPPRTRNGVPVTFPSLKTEDGREKVNEFATGVDPQHLRINGADMGFRNIAALAHDHPVPEASGSRVDCYVQGLSIYSSGTSLQLQREQSRLMAHFGTLAAAGLGIGAVPKDPPRRTRADSEPPLPSHSRPPSPRPRASSAPPRLPCPTAPRQRRLSAPPDLPPRARHAPSTPPPRSASAPPRLSTPPRRAASPRLPPPLPAATAPPPLDETFNSAVALALRTNTRRTDLRLHARVRRRADIQRAASQLCDQATGRYLEPETDPKLRRTLIYVGEDLASSEDGKRHGPDQRGRVLRELDVELKRRPGKGMIARTSEFETTQHCPKLWCVDHQGRRSRTRLVQRSDGSLDFGLVECVKCGFVGNRDGAAAFNMIGMGEMQRMYSEGLWRRAE